MFSQGNYTLEWSKTKLVTIFKEGNRYEIKNYRGISIMNSIAKLYDMVLYSQLQQLFTLCLEQEGSQGKRGYIEFIVFLVLCDSEKEKN